ncbi:class I SAM-dependent methyltransferase [Cellulomonas sp. URHD0024]|uniref:methyltransferase n=1 Tax=Cellulomonas sp. URHD0024 TaxID=1302620 RepID=UPI0003F99818|nr:class I SAM-dependent methyltransferase [Cellulomonas sp. URHD0024]
MSLDLAAGLVRRNAARTGPTVCTLNGRDWDLFEGVFSPTDDFSTAFFTARMPYGTGTFLEMGCGAGVTAVTAALRGCTRVMAVDVSAAAVRNTALNARRHGVADSVSALQSDLFDDVPAGEFDVVFWNSAFVDEPTPAGLPAELANTVFDSGYVVHRRFLQQAPEFLSAGGRLLLGFSSLGNEALLRQLAHEAEFDVEELDSLRGPARITYSLLELVRQRSAR